MDPVNSFAIHWDQLTYRTVSILFDSAVERMVNSVAQQRHLVLPQCSGIIVSFKSMSHFQYYDILTFTVLVWSPVSSTDILILFTFYKNINPFKVHTPKYLDIKRTDIYVSTLGMNQRATKEQQRLQCSKSKTSDLELGVYLWVACLWGTFLYSSGNQRLHVSEKKKGHSRDVHL